MYPRAKWNAMGVWSTNMFFPEWLCTWVVSLLVEILTYCARQTRTESMTLWVTFLSLSSWYLMVFQIGRLSYLRLYFFLICIPKEEFYFSVINVVVEYYECSLASIIWRFIISPPAMWFKKEFKTISAFPWPLGVLEAPSYKSGICLCWEGLKTAVLQVCKIS